MVLAESAMVTYFPSSMVEKSGFHSSVLALEEGRKVQLVPPRLLLRGTPYKLFPLAFVEEEAFVELDSTPACTINTKIGLGASNGT